MLVWAREPQPKKEDRVFKPWEVDGGGNQWPSRQFGSRADHAFKA